MHPHIHRDEVKKKKEAKSQIRNNLMNPNQRNSPKV